jgi:hypothetical protein
MWAEILERDTFKNKADFLDYLRKMNGKGKFKDYDRINTRIFSHGWKDEAEQLMRGYYLLEILKNTGCLELKFPLWRHFENLVGEMLRVALRKRQHLKVVYVDRLAGFLGLDWIVVNEHSSDTWRLGVQVKKNIGTGTSYWAAMGNPWKGNSTPKLIESSRKLEDRFGKHKRFALVASYAYRATPREKARWHKLTHESEWDIISVFESRRDFNPPYTYNLSFDKFDNLVAEAT